MADPVSIEALARHSRAMNVAYEAIHQARLACPKHIPAAAAGYEHAHNLIDDRGEAMQALALTLPARTLADAVFQVGHAMFLADRIRDGMTEGQDDSDIRGVIRALASVFRVIVVASGVDPGELVEEWCIDQWDKQFGGLEQALAGERT